MASVEPQLVDFDGNVLLMEDVTGDFTGFVTPSKDKKLKLPKNFHILPTGRYEYFEKKGRREDADEDEGLYKREGRLPVFSSAGIGSYIRDPVTNEPCGGSYIHKRGAGYHHIGSSEENLYFKVSVVSKLSKYDVKRRGKQSVPSLSGSGPDTIQLYFSSPDEYERCMHVKVSQYAREKWEERVQRALLQQQKILA